jgi:hypothetical protein
MSDGWWNDNDAGAGVGDYDPTQTATGPELMSPNTVYSPPGEANPIDQYNFAADPNVPGGWLSYPPGVAAPNDVSTFSNTSGQYPNDQDASQAIANQTPHTPTMDMAGNANFLSQFQQMQQQAQDTWNAQYGPQAAPYIWAQQAGLMEGAGAGFGALPQDQQNIWYGTYGDQAPQIWAQQAAAAGGGQQQGGFLASPQPDTWATYNNLAYSPQNNWYDPATGRHTGWGSIGAGTQWATPGYGVPGFGQAQIPINPAYMEYLKTAPGYIPGSGTYNQYRLDQGGLVGTVGGAPNMNLRYGQGGTGDPTTGLEPQTPEQWVQGGKLFNTTRTSSWGQGDQAGTGLDYIANLFMRSDTPSGIGTPAWSAPKAYWDGLAQQIAGGTVQPTARGWQALAEKGYTPEKIGGAAPAQAKGVGAGTGTGQGPMGPGTQAFNYQAAYLDYMNARMNMLEIPGMKNQDERARDQLAFEQAKQRWLEAYQQQTFGEGQRQFNELQGLRQGELTGNYNGQETLGQKQLNQQTSLGYLNLLGQLRGPGDIFQYLKVLQGTPGGMKDIVNAAAGAYRMPTTGGGATVGGYSNPSDISTLLGQMNNPQFGAEAQNLNLPPPNQINAQALLRMAPAQRQALMGAYESAGYNPQDVMAIFQNSLPRYAQQGGAGRVNLFGR